MNSTRKLFICVKKRRESKKNLKINHRRNAVPCSHRQRTRESVSESIREQHSSARLSLFLILYFNVNRMQLDNAKCKLLYLEDTDTGDSFHELCKHLHYRKSRSIITFNKKDPLRLQESTRLANDPVLKATFVNLLNSTLSLIPEVLTHLFHANKDPCTLWISTRRGF